MDINDLALECKYLCDVVNMDDDQLRDLQLCVRDDMDFAESPAELELLKKFWNELDLMIKG